MIQVWNLPNDTEKQAEQNMIKKKIEIVNRLGLHARAAMKLVNLASRYQSNILIRYNNREVDAKSIMNVMVLAASYGKTIELITFGNDEKEAMHAIEKLIKNKFGESE